MEILNALKARHIRDSATISYLRGWSPDISSFITPEDVVRLVAPRDLDAEAESAPSESFATLERGANKVGEFMDSSREVATTALNAREEDGRVSSALIVVMGATAGGGSSS